MISGLIIAGNYKQAHDWLKENGQSFQDYKYISNQNEWYGYRDIPIFLIGEYYKSDAFQALVMFRQVVYIQEPHDCKLFKKERNV